MLRRRQLLTLLVLVGVGCGRNGDDKVTVAAAANVAEVLKQIAAEFHKRGGPEVVISGGSSGKLYAQIENGAPFHDFFSADAERPAQLEKKGLTVPGSRFTYAFGQLALVGRKLEHPEDGAIDLRAGHFDKLAMANPATAPYGGAALQVLAKLGVSLSDDRIVRGENIAQTLQFVDSGAVDLGFVALSNVITRGPRTYWKVPAELHAPIRQDAVLLSRGKALPAAADFLAFVRTEPARALLVKAGYDVPPHD